MEKTEFVSLDWIFHPEKGSSISEICRLNSVPFLSLTHSNPFFPLSVAKKTHVSTKQVLVKTSMLQVAILGATSINFSPGV